MMHFHGEEKVWECTRCGCFFPIPEELTRASGSFASKAQRCVHNDGIDDQKKPMHPREGLIKIQDAYKTRKEGA
jgi:hypothetical protein